ncbi:MAG TPA: hypothetical protein VGK16_02100 [Candidatus Limnocylindrales bacterium]
MQLLEVDRVLEAAGGVLQREVADPALHPGFVECARTGPRAQAGDAGRDGRVVELDPLREIGSPTSSPGRARLPHSGHGSMWSLRWRQSANVPSLRTLR